MTDPTQQWHADTYAANARFVAELGSPVLDLLAPRPGERILDLGCGDGALTEKIAAAGASVLGVDTAPDLLRAACERGLDVRHMDGHALRFDEKFDAVFSNAALHWMTQPALVIAGVAAALKPGGRFVGEMGGHGNVAAIVTALRAVLAHRLPGQPIVSPWFYPTADEYAALLTQPGFKVDSIALIPRPTPLPTGMSGWLATFRGPWLRQVAPDQHETLQAEIEDLLAPSLRDTQGRWTADYVRLRFCATWNG